MVHSLEPSGFSTVKKGTLNDRAGLYYKFETPALIFSKGPQKQKNGIRSSKDCSS